MSMLESCPVDLSDPLGVEVELFGVNTSLVVGC